ncbi:MAG: hypothetical protein AVDCRST_MAG57-3874, partial [uncultured Blastococcus sp.]
VRLRRRRARAARRPRGVRGGLRGDGLDLRSGRHRVGPHAGGRRLDDGAAAARGRDPSADRLVAPPEGRGAPSEV